MSRITQGGNITTTNNKQFWNRKVYENHYTDTVFTITPKYEFQPDLIAYDMYGDTSYEWLVLQFNNITDPWTQLKVGVIVRLPTLSRLGL